MKRAHHINKRQAGAPGADLVGIDDSFEFYEGPSPWCAEPAIFFRLTTADTPLDLDGAMDRLAVHFPDMVGRLRPSIADAAPDESVASLVSTLAAKIQSDILDLDIASGWHREADGKIACWTEYIHRKLATRAISGAIGTVRLTLAGHAVAPGLFKLIADAEVAHAPDYIAAAMIAAARKRKIPFLQISDVRSLWQFGWGAKSVRFWQASSDKDGYFAYRISSDKVSMKQLLVDLGLPTPAWRVVGNSRECRNAAEAIGFPCVAKPVTGFGGRGVTVGIENLDGLMQAVEGIKRHAQFALVEKQCDGDDHRLMLTHGKLTAAVKRLPPSVTGDGAASIGELVEAVNRSRSGSLRSAGYLRQIPDDRTLADTLASQGVSKETILPKGQTVLLRRNANCSTGGTAIDVLDQVHPQVRMIAEQVAAAFGFATTGIDYMTPDISRTPEEVGGAILELNGTPGLDVLLAAGADEDALAANIIGPIPGRIPVVLVIGQASDLQAIGRKYLRKARAGEGLALSGAGHLAGAPLPGADLNAAQRVRAFLRLPTLERLFILWTEEDLRKFGLPVDAVDRCILVGAPPDREWLDVLKSRSGDIDARNSANGVAELLTGGSPEADAKPSPSGKRRRGHG